MAESNGEIDVIEAVTAHIDRSIGKVSYVIHEIASEDVHVDLYLVEPTRKHPYFTLVTSGMSELPMKVPEDAMDGQFAEVMICLPKTWPLDRKNYELFTGTEEYYWPVRLLTTLARYPHSDQTWLYGGHTFVDKDPPEPFAANTRMSSALLLRPQIFADAHEIHFSETRKGLLWAVYPLYIEELELKLTEGSDEVERRFIENQITELLDPQRRSVVQLN